MSDKVQRHTGSMKRESEGRDYSDASKSQRSPTTVGNQPK